MDYKSKISKPSQEALEKSRAAKRANEISTTLKITPSGKSKATKKANDYRTIKAIPGQKSKPKPKGANISAISKHAKIAKDAGMISKKSYAAKHAKPLPPLKPKTYGGDKYRDTSGRLREEFRKGKVVSKPITGASGSNKVSQAISKAQADNTAFKSATSKAPKRLEGVDKVVNRALKENTRYKTMTESAAKVKGIKVGAQPSIFSKAAKLAKTPVVRGVIGKTILRPLGVAADIAVTGQAVYEGYKAAKAKQHQKRTEANTKDLYGTVAKATATRRRRTGKR